MNRTILGLVGILGATLIVSTWASYAGWSAPVPEKEPPSIREGSAKGGAAHGRSGTRFFIGGGHLAGK